jgi:hypothetical protein
MEQLHLFLWYVLAVICHAAILHLGIDQMVALAEQSTVMARIKNAQS